MDLERVFYHSLLRDELSYEVTIRAETPEDTVAKLRKQLKGLCVGIAPAEFVCEELESGKELTTIQDKLEELQSKVESAEKTRDSHSLARGRALYCHLHHRLQRLSCRESKECMLQEKLRNLMKGYRSTLDKLFRRSDTEKQPSDTEDNSDSHSNYMVLSKHVCKWNVYFDGKTCPFQFLESIAERAKAFKVPDSVLFDSAFAFFKGDALLWHRSAKCQVSTWKELADLLLREFNAIDYEDNLLDVAKKRMQGNDEPIHMYFAVMNALFSRLTIPLTEQEKIKILKKNVKPSISRGLVLVKPDSVAELKDVCRLLEAEDIKSNTYNNTPTDSKQKQKIASVNQLSDKNTHKQTDGKQRPQSTKNEVKCFKCGKLGYTKQTCPNCKCPKRKFKCYKCGKLGYTVKTCPDCTKIPNDPKN